MQVLRSRFKNVYHGRPNDSIVDIALRFVHNMWKGGGTRVEKIYASLVNEAFGERLSRIRRDRRVSQKELAKRVGRSRATIANLENGSQNVLLHYVYAVAKALDADVLEFMPDLREVSLMLPTANDQGFLEMARRQLGGILGDLENEKS